MKTIFTTIFLIFLNIVTYSQHTWLDSFKKKDYYPNGNIKAEYWLRVINSDTLFHGERIRYNENGGVFDKSTWDKGIIVGTREIFDKKGRVLFRETYFDGDYPRTIISQAYYYDFLAACNTSIGFYIETGFMTKQQHGALIYYWKNGIMMDSLVFDHGVQKYRAHFNRKGELDYEEKY